MSEREKILEKHRQQQAKAQADRVKDADAKAKKAKATKGAGRGKKGDAPITNMKAHLRTVVPPKKTTVPLSKQMKDCLDALQRAQEPLTPAQIQEATGHDCGAESQLLELLANNPKVGASGGTLRFKAVADVKVMDREGALKFIQSSRGCLLRDLTAAYPGAPDDVARLKAEGLVWILPAAEKDQEAVFASEQPPMISVSEEVMQLWHQVEIPEDLEDQAKDMKRANIVSAVQRGKRERPKSNKKEKKKRPVNFDRFKRITNVHLPQLFKGVAGSID